MSLMLGQMCSEIKFRNIRDIFNVLYRLGCENIKCGLVSKYKTLSSHNASILMLCATIRFRLPNIILIKIRKAQMQSSSIIMN